MRVQAAVMEMQGMQAPFAESRPFSIEDIELEAPGTGEVLVEIRAAGLCHSDLTTVEGLRPRRLPVIGGHEGAGVVIEAGPGVTRLKPGDHVVLTAAAGCGTCPTCGNGRPVLCEEIPRTRLEGALVTGARRFRRNGERLYHYSGVSSFSQYTVVGTQSAVKIEKSYPLDVAALFGCAVITGAGAVFNAARATAGSTIAVIGLGGVGLNAVMAASSIGCPVIVGLDINPDKLDIGRKLGCTHVFDGGDGECVTAIRDLTGGGVDIVIELSGRQVGIDRAFEITRRGAEIVCVGIAGYGTRYQYPHGSLVGDEKLVRGSLLGSGNPQADIPDYLRLYGEGRLPVDRLISDRITLAEINSSLDRLKTGAALRQVIIP